MLAAAGDALTMLLDPTRMMILFGGVLMGLGLGIIPGIGGVVGMAILLPFTFTMDPYTALALLLGMSAVTGTSDTIPAVMFGVPGTSGAQATVLDGNPMAKRGEPGRALAAAYSASLIGGLFGALLLALTIPLLRPLMLHIGSPELLALSIFGIATVAALSGRAPLRGLAAAGIGVLLSMIGSDPQTGTLRWTMDSMYLWEGLPIVPLVLGLFALPELADLAIKRSSITDRLHQNARAGMAQGFRDAMRNLPLIGRCGALGAFIGAIPGMGSAVVDWFAYGHALRTVKGARETFGKGDVRGVIAPESANNSNNSGALVPTIAFGVPGSTSMAILLGAFLIQGLVPGPEMLTTNLDVTYAMVWSIAIANIFGAGICFLFSGQLAKVALLRYTLILPFALTVMYIGAFQATRSWGDFYALLAFGVLGWVMKRLEWPRPPLILGFVLGALIERYMFVSIGRYGAEWLLRPVVLLFLALALLALVRPLMHEVRELGGLRALRARIGPPSPRPSDLFYVVAIVAVGLMIAEASTWFVQAQAAPMIVGIFTLVVLGSSLVYQMVSRAEPGLVALGDGTAGMSSSMHMDSRTDFEGLAQATILARAATFFGWLLAFMASTAMIGLIPTVPLFIIAFMRIEGREAWHLTLIHAGMTTLFVYVLFDRLLSIPWPHTLLGDVLPAAGMIPSV
jgi:TctA family transporter